MSDFSEMFKRSIDVLYNNFKEVASKDMLARQVRKNIKRAKKRDRLHLAKMWVRYYEYADWRLGQQNKIRNGWDKDPIPVQMNRAALMMDLRKAYPFEEVFQNSTYMYYKKIIADAEKEQNADKIDHKMLLSRIQEQLKGLAGCML